MWLDGIEKGFGSFRRVSPGFTKLNLKNIIFPKTDLALLFVGSM